MNPFSPGDKVKTIDGSKTNGVVKYIACHSATSGGGKTCKRTSCPHLAKDHCFVLWSNGALASYHHNELAFINPPAAASFPSKEPDTQPFGKVEEGREPIVNQQDNQNTLNYQIYNGFLQVRYTRDGKEYLVDVAGTTSAEAPIIQEDELDYDAYANRTINVRKSR